jgi:hypothetical protein
MRNRVYQTERVTEAIIEPTQGEHYVLVYFLQTLESAEDGDIYALRVDKLTRDGIQLEREETYAITGDKKEAMLMARAFARGSVPPCVLLEMADEWLSQSAHAHTYRRAG